MPMSDDLPPGLERERDRAIAAEGRARRLAAEVQTLQSEKHGLEHQIVYERAVKGIFHRKMLRLRAALERYGRHFDGCVAHLPPYECTCGLVDALEEKEEE